MADFSAADMTNPSVENGFTDVKEPDNHERENNSHLPAKAPTRPTGIPRLSSGKTGIYQPRNAKTPLSPGNPLNRPNSTGSYSKSPSPERYCEKQKVVSPTYQKRSRNYAQTMSNDPSRNRSAIAQSLNRYDRAMSEENPVRESSRDSSFSEMTNNSSQGNSRGVITSKIGSLQNARHKPGGGNVEIVDRKLDFSNISSKCGSKKNMRYRPGGGDVQIFDRKIEFTKVASSKVNSLKNVTHRPTGGEIKIENRKLEWKVESKVGSLQNVKHRPSGGRVQIHNEPLPWLRFNKPNLPAEEIARINKKSTTPLSPTSAQAMPLGSSAASRSSYSNSICSDRST